METAEEKLRRLEALATSVDGFCLQLKLEEIQKIAANIYTIEGRSLARLVEDLPYEQPPSVNLIDRRNIVGREHIWTALSDLYHKRLVAVNSDPSSSTDYDNYIAKLSASNTLPPEPKSPLSADRPLTAPALGTIIISIMHVVWDDVSMALSIEYSGYMTGVNGSAIDLAGARQRDLYALMGTHDRSRPAAEVGADLIKRWKAKDDSKGEIGERKMGLRSKITGEVRPVQPVQPTEVLQSLPPQPSSTHVHDNHLTSFPSSITANPEQPPPNNLPTIIRDNPKRTTYPILLVNDAPTSPPSTISREWSVMPSKHSPAISQPTSPETPNPVAVQPVPISNKSPSQPLSLSTSAPAKPKRIRRKLQKRAKPIQRSSSIMKRLLGCLCFGA